MKASECRNKSEVELKQELLALRKEQFNLRMQKKMGQLPKSHLVRKARKEIALIKTILKEKGSMV
jgi:large subunit ribosomal protein L29